MFQIHKKMCSHSQWVKHLNLHTNLIIISGMCASNLSGATSIPQMFQTNGQKKSFAFNGKRLCSLAGSDFRRQVGGRHKSFDLKLASSQVPVSPLRKQTTNFSGKTSLGTRKLMSIFFKLCHLVTTLQCWTQVRGWGGEPRGDKNDFWHLSNLGVKGWNLQRLQDDREIQLGRKQL